MSWSIDLKLDRPLEDADMDKIVAELPDELQGWGRPKQSWGWSCVCDIVKRDEKSIYTHGATNESYRLSDRFTRHIKKELIKSGYKVRRGRFSH